MSRRPGYRASRKSIRREIMDYVKKLYENYHEPEGTWAEGYWIKLGDNWFRVYHRYFPLKKYANWGSDSFVVSLGYKNAYIEKYYTGMGWNQPHEHYGRITMSIEKLAEIVFSSKTAKELYEKISKEWEKWEEEKYRGLRV